MRTPRRGLALVVVIGVLGVMACLAVAFATMARLERRASQQRVHAAKAELLARSGIEDALARISAGQDPDEDAHAYGGEDWNGNGAALPDPGVERDSQAYEPGVCNVEDCPVRYALRPSFFARTAGAPSLTRVDAGHRGLSGVLSGDLAPTGNHYALRVVGENGIYVNGGAPADPPDSTCNAPLRQLFGTLSSEIGLAPSEGFGLIERRPPEGWRSLDQVRAVLDWSEASARAFRPYLCFHTWTDRKVIRPNPFLDDKDCESWADFKTGIQDSGYYAGLRRFNATLRSWAPDFERDSAGRVVGRAPINLNWARKRPALLQALLALLWGRGLDERSGCNRWFPSGDPAPNLVGRARAFTADVSHNNPATIIPALKDALATHAGFPAAEYPSWDGTARFDSWEEFDRFVDKTLPVPTTASEEQVALVKAAFNPNSDLNRCNPNRTLWRTVDKSDLCATREILLNGLWTMAAVPLLEFGFDTPCRRVSALGRVAGPGGRLLAERALSVVIQADERFRMTAQSEFCAGDGGLGRLDVAGDESNFRLPGAAGFISPSNDSLTRTFGSRLGLPGSGLGLQTYPEPQFGAGSPPPAAYDGNLQLATVECHNLPNGMWLNWTTLQASFDDGLGADWVLAGKWDPTCATEARHVPGDVSVMGRTDDPARGSEVGTLYPDGCYSEWRRTPAYRSLNTVPSLAGMVSLWVKPNFTLLPPNYGDGTTGRGHLLLDLTYTSDTRAASAPDQQVFFLACTRNTAGVSFPADEGMGLVTPNRWTAFVERGFPPGDLDGSSELGWAHTLRDPLGRSLSTVKGHRWHLLTFQWNFRDDVAGADDVGRLLLDKLPPSEGLYAENQVDPGLSSPRPPGHDPTLTSTDARTLLCLGARGGQAWRTSFAAYAAAADATLDELAVYNLFPFGAGPEITNLDTANVLQDRRWSAGRYYKGNLNGAIPDGRWTSALVPLPPGALVTRLDWTLQLPRFDPTDPGDPNRAFYGKGISDVSTGRGADALLEILDPGSGPLYAASTPGGRPGLPVPAGGLRLRATLRPNLADNPDRLDVPLLESPVLDDITVTYLPPGGPRLLAWSQGDSE